MFFADGLKSGFTNLFSTHPPLIRRIKAIEKRFDGVIPSLNYEQLYYENNPQKLDEKKKVESKSPDSALDAVLKNPLEQIMGQIGTIPLASLGAASLFLNNLENSLKWSCRDPYTARLVIYLTLIDETKEVYQDQCKIINEALSKKRTN